MPKVMDGNGNVFNVSQEDARKVRNLEPPYDLPDFYYVIKEKKLKEEE